MEEKKPNVIFILTDDQRFSTIHSLGNNQIKTPNLDKLVSEGVAFTNAHIPSGTSGAVCMPSRAMINSSKTLFHLYGRGEEIPKTDITMGECFKNNGYETIGIGKWHNGTESYSRSFTDGRNIFFGGMWDHWNVPYNDYHKDGKYENVIKYTRNFEHANHPMELVAEKIEPGKHSTELFTEAALNIINSDHDKPYFIYLSYLAPHDPRTMPEEFQNMYKKEDIELPENYLDEHPFYIGINPSIGENRDEDLAGHPRKEDEIKQHIADYYAMITHIDYNIGKIIDALKAKGEYDNTVIVFCGDNGLAVGQHGLMGKQDTYDHSIRVPLIIKGPRVEKGIKADEFVYLLDIYPTLCNYLGFEIPKSVEGISFSHMLKGNNTSIRNDLYFAYTKLIRAVKDRKYKLIEYKLSPDNNQLFDLENDPMEVNNLYNDEKYRHIIERLHNRILEYRDEWEDNPLSEETIGYWKS